VTTAAARPAVVLKNTGPPTAVPPAGEEPVQLLTPNSTLGELEDFAAAMRAGGAGRSSIILASIEPSMDRRHSGFVTRLGGYPHASRGAAAPEAGSATAGPVSGHPETAAPPPTIQPAD
jgi:hypothetical protein